MEAIKMRYDVAVIGAGAGGFAAAVRAAREGCRVILVDRNGFIGGNIHLNLPWLSFLNRKGDRRIVGGIAQEVIERLAAQGACLGHYPCPLHISATCIDANCFEIEAAKMCRQAGVDLLLHSEIFECEVRNRRLVRVSVLGKYKRMDIEAKVFIDATGDGDLGVLSGAGCEIGREDTGEVMPVSLTYILENVDIDKFWDFLDDHPEHIWKYYGGITADFFRKSKSYVTYFMPEYLKELWDKGERRYYRPSIVFAPTPAKGRLFILATRMINVDAADVRDLTRAEVEGRLELPGIIEFQREKLPGFENCRLGGINPVIGLREGHRIMGKSLLRYEDIHNGRIPEDSVALGSYLIDIHTPEKSGESELSGDTWFDEPYGIAYGCLVSRDIDGLMMCGRCISVDSVAIGSSRVIPTCMATGEAAGAGAALAVNLGISPAQVSPGQVRALLRKGGAIVSMEDTVSFVPDYD